MIKKIDLENHFYDISSVEALQSRAKSYPYKLKGSKYDSLAGRESRYHRDKFCQKSAGFYQISD